MTVVFSLLVFIFAFWLIHIIGRIFEHTYLWQIKEYRWDRILVHIKESGVLSLKSYKTIVAIVLSILGVVLIKFMDCRALYLVIVLGFGYYVYSTLEVITKFLNKKITRPKKSLRNLIIAGSVLMMCFLPIIAAFLFMSSFDIKPLSDETSTEFMQIFPKQDISGVLIIPLETVTIILYFALLFIFDSFIPALVASVVTLTLPISSIIRKKK